MSVEEQSFSFDGGDGERIAAYRWRAPGLQRGVLVVAHGMGEHARRYRAGLAEVITAGWAVYAPDHRGHGATGGGPERHGDFGPGGFAAVVDDLAVLMRRARSESPDGPVVLLGHSMGSFAAQAFALDHADLIDGLALSGSAALDRLTAVAAQPNTLGSLNAPFEPARTPFDWLSTDPAQVDLYVADPDCGFSLNRASSLSMARLAGRMADPAELARLPKDLPIYIFSGLDDPLAGMLGALQPLIDRYRAAGLDLSTDLYPGRRHELLNEANRGEVVAALLRWLERVTVRSNRQAA